MAINRYDTPAQAEFINTYVPIPFEQLYTLGRDAKAEVDKAIAEQSAALSKWSEFRSPSAVDTAAWNEATLGAVKPVIDKLASNPDLIKTVEGRSMLRSAINNVDTSKLALLQQSRDTLLQRQKVDQELMIKGLYNPEWHNLDYNNYNTLSSGIFNDVSPLAYQSIQDLTDPYYKGIQDSYLYTKGGYDYSGVTRDQIAEITDKNLSGIMVTPVAQKHMEVYKKQTGATDEEAKDWLRNKVIQDNLRYERINRDENKFALIGAQASAKAAKASAPAGTEKTLVAKALETIADKPMPQGGVQGAPKYNSKMERIAKTFQLTNDNPYRKNYVEKIPTNGQTVNELRLKSAKNIISSLSTPFGQATQYINEAELGAPKAFNANNRPIYDATNITGIMTEDFFVNNKMGIPRENYQWSAEKDKFAQDLLNGVIPNTVISPSDAFMPLDVEPGRESFAQRGEAYIPVSYLYEVFPKYVNTKPTDTDFSYAKLWDNKDFQAFAKEIGLSRVGDTGAIVPRKGTKLSSEDKNTQYQYTDQGIFSSDLIGISQSFPDAYVKLNVIRPVLTNPIIRDRANQLEAIARKTGTKGTAAVVSQSEFENFIIEE